VTDALPLGVTEVHMVGGLHPTLKKDWYVDLLRRLRALDPQLHIKAFTAIEVRHLAQRVFKMPIRDTLEILAKPGLVRSPGVAPRFSIRSCATKSAAARKPRRMARRASHWHSMGGRSTCTMLYGHIETLAHRADHLRQLRQLQDETGGFTGFVPFAFEPRNPTESLPTSSAPPHLSNCATSR
jgi:Thiamine biosynthesis enzyme ThiH and related uncharacterized enzymes